MHPHYNRILEHIRNKYQVQEYEDWMLNKNQKLKEFRTSLELKIKEIVVTDETVASFFLDKGVIHHFIKLEKKEREKAIKKYIVSKQFNPRLDLRTLKNALSGDRLPSHNRILNAFSIYVYGTTYEYSRLKESTAIMSNPKDIIKEDGAFTTQNTSKEVSRKRLKIKPFLDTYWWLYFYDYDQENRLGRLGRAVLHIESENNVTVENVISETSTNYKKGSIGFGNSSQHLYLDLTVNDFSDKHLRIILHKGVGKVYPLLIGMYTSIYATNSIASGCLILERVVDEDIIINMKPKSFTKEEALSEGIDQSIIEFLEERGKNFIKSPSGIFTKRKLSSWLLLQKQKI